MKMYLTSLISIFLIFVDLSVASGSVNDFEFPETRWSNNQKLTNIGTVNGSTFYSANQPKRTWPEAKKFCEDNKLKLARITSRRQSDYLKERLPYYGAYWTAARDLLFANAFFWDGSNDNDRPNGDHFPGAWVTTTNPRICAAVMDEKGKSLHMRSWFCTEKLGTLCYKKS